MSIWVYYHAREASPSSTPHSVSVICHALTSISARSDHSALSATPGTSQWLCPTSLQTVCPFSLRAAPPATKESFSFWLQWPPSCLPRVSCRQKLLEDRNRAISFIFYFILSWFSPKLPPASFPSSTILYCDGRTLSLIQHRYFS